MLVKRLLGTLRYNEQQYINSRTRLDYANAMIRLQNMAKLLRLIYRLTTNTTYTITSIDAFNIVRAHHHLVAMGILPTDEFPPPQMEQQARLSV